MARRKRNESGETSQQRESDVRKQSGQRRRFAGLERGEDGFLHGSDVAQKHPASDQLVAMGHALKWLADEVLSAVDKGEPVAAELALMVRAGYEAVFEERLDREWAERLATALMLVRARPPAEQGAFLDSDVETFAMLGPRRPWPLLYPPPAYVTNRVLRWAFAHGAQSNEVDGGRSTLRGLRDLLLRPEELAAAIERADDDKIAARELRAWISKNKSVRPATCIFDGEEDESQRAGEHAARMRLVTATRASARHLLMKDVLRACAETELCFVPDLNTTRLLALEGTVIYRVARRRLYELGTAPTDAWLLDLIRPAGAERPRAPWVLTVLLHGMSLHHREQLESGPLAAQVEIAVTGWREALIRREQPPADDPSWHALVVIAEAMGMSRRSPAELAGDWKVWQSGGDAAEGKPSPH